MGANSIRVRHNTGFSPVVPIGWSRVVTPIFLLLLIISFSLVVYGYLSDSIRFPVSRVEVGGKIVFLDKTRLINLTKKHTSKGFFTLNIDDVKSEVIALPWVESVQIRRYFPDRLYIYIEERSAVMQWNDNALISNKGEAFYPYQLQSDNEDLIYWHEYFSSLPHLRGEDARVNEVQMAYMAYRKDLDIQELTVSGLSEDERHSQLLLLNNSIIVKLGYEQQMKRLKRFIQIIPKYKELDENKDVLFDMRYTNGFTIAFAGKQSDFLTGSY